MEFIENLNIGHSVDWKFGLSTRDVFRSGFNTYVISDFSSGWVQATVDKDTLIKLFGGEISLLDLDWK